MSIFIFSPASPLFNVEHLGLAQTYIDFLLNLLQISVLKRGEGRCVSVIRRYRDPPIPEPKECAAGTAALLYPTSSSLLLLTV